MGVSCIFQPLKCQFFWCFYEHAQYAKYKIMSKVSYFLILQAMAFPNIYTCLGFLLMTKSLLHVEAMCVPPEKGSRPLTVVCYLKERLFWGFFQKKSIFFGENTSKNSTISLLPAVGTNVWGFIWPKTDTSHSLGHKCELGL